MIDRPGSDRVMAQPDAGASIELSQAIGRLRAAFLQILLASAVINVLALASPLFMMTVYNRVISHGALQTLDVIAIGMLALFGFEVILRALRGHVASRLAARLDVAFSGILVERTLALPLRSLERLAGQGFATRLRQLDQLRTFFAGNLPTLLVDLAFVVLFVGALFALAPILAIVTMAAMPFFLLLSLMAGSRQEALAQAAAQQGAEKMSCLGEALGQAFGVKALGLEGMVRRRFERRLLDGAWAGFRAGSLAGRAASLGTALQHLTALAVIYVGAREIVAGQLSIGALVAATILSSRALAPMRQVIGSWQTVKAARGAFQEIKESLARSPQEEAPARPVELEGTIRFDGVSFRYAVDRPPALDELSFEVGSGTMLAVVGPPGSGKSTLVRLLLGLDRPDAGRVLLDGHDLAHLPIASVRRQIGVVPQEIQLFAGSVAENIAAGGEVPFARIVTAAKFVGLHDQVQTLPAGYDTELGDRGQGLSLGQRQLVAIARALVHNPRLLVLDEATSALDAVTEGRLLASLRRAAGGRTIIMVTHRRSVMEACDRVLVLENGRAVREGRPHELGRLGRAATGGAKQAREATA